MNVLANDDAVKLKRAIEQTFTNEGYATIVPSAGALLFAYSKRDIQILVAGFDNHALDFTVTLAGNIAGAPFEPRSIRISAFEVDRAVSTISAAVRAIEEIERAHNGVVDVEYRLVSEH